MGFVYALLDKSDNVRYVGKTERNWDVRKAEHVYNSKSERTHLYCWIRSLGEFPAMKLLEECGSSESLNEAEKRWIRTFKNLTNHTKGGEGQPGLKHSEETKRKISAAAKGRKQPWARANIKIARELSPNWAKSQALQSVNDNDNLSQVKVV